MSEALLVGEGKPYVTALLWLEDGAREGFDPAVLEAEVYARNEELSHPEQVKRWVVMDQQLSIAAGELTPNLKLRRSNVAERNAAIIDALYSADYQAIPAVLHVGLQR
ncbi:MAG: hypothetical protein Q4C36_04795 [Coriobacteriia bacterium]|nr:hypothetical protein [Coriobacteriia bacterium]